MGRTLLTLASFLIIIWWLNWEFKRKVSFTRYWRWIAAALTIQLISSIVFYFYTGVAGNFFYHAVGGGVLTGLFFAYLLKTYSLKFNWRIELVLLFALVSSLGVLNELAEYVVELTDPSIHLSWDTHDTWRDFVANTSGAILAWFVTRPLYAKLKARN